MTSYRTEWPCCKDITLTDGWIPTVCPFCSASRFKEALEKIKDTGSKNSGYGYTCSELSKEALNNLSDIRLTDITIQ